MSCLVEMLTAASGLSERDVRRIVSNAPSRYKNYVIPKRSGGERLISQPAREVKLFQRIIVEEVLSKLPVHDAAMAYCKGKSIKSNAEAHVHNGPILKFDFSDFFPSIVSKDWRLYCKEHNVFESDEDIDVSIKVLFHRARRSSILRLAIGAPSSPILSNIIMFNFDRKITESVAKDKVRYTRYADDITFSAKRVGNLSDVEKILRKTIKELDFPRLRINEEKTVLSTKKYRRVVTGLVLSNDGEVSLGRDRKRTIRAALHHYKMGQLSSEKAEALSGLLAYVNAVEPEFINRLKEKYGEGLMISLRY